MRKRNKGRKLSRKKDQRKALLRTLMSSFFLKEKIQTTEAKAREISSLAEKFITKARKGDLACRRLLARFFSSRVVKKLVEEIAPQYKDRTGGYTRIIKTGRKKTDAAKMAIIELVK